MSKRHLITPEYPPQHGGVSDYTQMIATGLAAAGDEVHVWGPAEEQRSGVRGQRSEVGDQRSEGRDQRSEVRGQKSEVGDQRENGKLIVHRELGQFTRSDLQRVGSELDQFEAPRRLLVQWVPHGYGYRAMNLRFCLWLWSRARRGDRVELMVHEPFLSFREGSWKQSAVAVVHRLMIMILLRAAHRVWITIPAWEKSLRPYALGKKLSIDWLPVASNIAVVDDALGIAAVRDRCGSTDGRMVGHFGTYDRNITSLLLRSIPALLNNGNRPSVLLLGRGSELMRNELAREHPEIANRIYATGDLNARDLSLHLSACDVMLQPYIDGVSSRRTSTMVALAHGVPVVTTSGRLTEPLWANSEAVALAPAEDMPALVEKTRQLLPDAVARERMSAAARSLYAECFDASRIVAALREAAD